MDNLDALLIRIRNLNHFTRNYQEDEQLGLLYIATFCKTKGDYNVKVLDEYSISLDLINRTLKKSKAGVIGFFTDHENIWAVCKAIKKIKEDFPSAVCVVGGPQVSADPWTKRIFKEAPVDIVVIGEGEHAFLSILDVIIKKIGELSNITGIVYRNKNKIVTTAKRIAERNLDIFPIPDRNLNYYGKRQEGNENIITARGCPNHCTFCFEGRDSIVKIRSIDSVLEEVEMLLRGRNMVYLAILDDSFTLNRKRVLQMCDGFKRLQEKYHRFAWFCEGRVDIISRYPEIAKALYDAGLVRLQIGVETGNQHILDAYKKGITLNQIRECLDICYKANVLSVIGNIIIGGAFENYDTLRKTTEFTCELISNFPGCYDFNTTIYTPYPGTDMYNNPQNYGMKINDLDCVTGMGDNYAFCETQSLSKWEILDARHQMMESFESVATSVIPKISEYRRLEHFRLFYLYGIQTIWFQVMASERRLYNYYGLQVSSQKTTFHSMTNGELYNMKPIRTINIGSSVDGQLILPFLGKPIKLGLLGGKILEYCCGKLTVSEIINRLHVDMQKRIPHKEIEQYVRKTLTQLDSEHLILLSEI